MPILKLDLDGKVEWKRLRIVKKMFDLRIDFLYSRWAKTRNGYHIYLFLKNVLDEKAICFIQCAMGSDYRREVFNWMRIIRGAWKRRTFNVLFTKKFAVDWKGRLILTSEEKELPISSLKRHLRD